MSKEKGIPFAFAALILMLAFAMTTIGCQPSNVSQNKSRTSIETDVAFSFLSQVYESTISNHAPLVIEDTFSIQMLRLPDQSYEKWKKSLMAQASDDIPADLIEDFCTKNARPQKVWPELKNRLSTVLLGEKEMESIFSHRNGKKPDGWDIFYQKYPNSPGIITLSRVGFNRRGDLAMIYMGWQSHWLAGRGRICILRKQGEKWVDTGWLVGAIWVS